MSAELHVTPSRATNANGLNLDGAKWFFYQTGTTTPQSVYTTADLDVAHTNPVVADAAGKFPPIYFNASLQYRGVLKSADEATTIYDIDPINAGVLSTLAASGGSALVGFLQAGTGAVARTAQAKMREIVSVKDFGATGDGVADDTAEIQAAVDYLATAGGELLFPPGTYKITSQIVKALADGIHFTIRGYGAKIDATALSTLAEGAIEIGGSRSTSTALGATVTKNADTFTVASATGITKGRLLLITSTDLWNPTRPNYYKGEIALVEAISGTTITNANPLYDGYTNTTTTIHLLNAPYVTVEGLEIECNADNIGLKILYARNPTVRNCTVHGSRYSGIYVGYCLGATVDSNFIYDVWNGTVTGTSYGVVLGTGQGLKVVNNTIYSARHAIAGGSFEPMREVVYANNICHNSTLENDVGCIDIHGSSEFVIVTGNVASSILCAGINVIFSNNILNSAEANVPGILIFQEINSDYYVISGNRITCAGSASNGILINPTETNITISELNIQGNTVQSVIEALKIQPRASADTGCAITTAIIRNNKFRSTGSSGAQAFSFTNNGAATYTMGQLLSSGNVYEAAAHDAFITLGNPITVTNSVGDVFRANRNAGSLAYFCGTEVRLTSPAFYGSTGGAGNSRSVYYDNSGRVTVTNPVFSNLTYKAELGTPTEYVENGWHSATPTILNTSSARLINFYATLGRAVTYAAAAPAAGTWAVGDRVFNESPAVGQPKSWVCTVAGTPGTWVSEGAL